MAHKMKGFILRLSDEEFEKSNKLAESTGLTRQDYLRYLCRGIRFKPCPDEELKEVGAEIALSATKSIASRWLQIPPV